MTETSNFPLFKRPLHILLILSPVFFAIFLLIIACTYRQEKPDRDFEAYTRTLFCQEITTNTLNLHYTLASPQDYGIESYPLTLGNYSADDTPYIVQLENMSYRLHSIPYEKLSPANRLTYDILTYYVQVYQQGTELSPFLNDYISPTLGIQAQLPVLFAEYAFYTSQDVEDYLSLIRSMPEYFQQIIDFEMQKAQQGYFMNSESAQKVIDQIQEILKNKESFFLRESFRKKLEALTTLTSQQRKSYETAHEKLLKESFFPSYEQLSTCLHTLTPYSRAPVGLYYYPQGKLYYEYLLQSEIGTTDSLEIIRTRLLKKLSQDYEQFTHLYAKTSTQAAANDTLKALETSTPKQMLQNLNRIITKDFPLLADTTYQIKNVDESLQSYLSPAFYFIPPLDKMNTNIIYLNPSSDLKGVELYTTLAHEGFPGHLYQTQTFAKTNPNPIRYLYSNDGYIEGWATYVESFAYHYALDTTSPDTAQMHWLNRSINLNLASILDLSIHYYGWTESQCRQFLLNFGITDTANIHDWYLTILETPANYLKYYYGYYNFALLSQKCKSKQKESYSEKEFHQTILTIGPAPFPILEKYCN